MQYTFFGLLIAILALKRPYLTLYCWVQSSSHEVGLSPAVWTGDRLNWGLPLIAEFFLRHMSLRCFIQAGARLEASPIIVFSPAADTWARRGHHGSCVGT